MFKLLRRSLERNRLTLPSEKSCLCLDKCVWMSQNCWNSLQVLKPLTSFCRSTLSTLKRYHGFKLVSIRLEREMHRWFGACAWPWCRRGSWAGLRFTNQYKFQLTFISCEWRPKAQYCAATSSWNVSSGGWLGSDLEKRIQLMWSRHLDRILPDASLEQRPDRINWFNTIEPEIPGGIMFFIWPERELRSPKRKCKSLLLPTFLHLLLMH